MNRLKLLASIFSILSLIAIPALADTSPNTTDTPSQSVNYNRHTGFYLSGNLGVGAGAVIEEDDSTRGGFEGLGASAYLGYMFTPYVGLEGGISYFALLLSDETIYGATVVGNLPLGQRFNLFGKLGGGVLRSHLDEIDFGFFKIPEETQSQGAVLVGAGLGFAFTKNLSLTTQYNAAVVENRASDNGIIGLLSLGLQWHFA